VCNIFCDILLFLFSDYLVIFTSWHGHQVSNKKCIYYSVHWMNYPCYLVIMQYGCCFKLFSADKILFCESIFRLWKESKICAPIVLPLCHVAIITICSYQCTFLHLTYVFSCWIILEEKLEMQILCMLRVPKLRRGSNRSQCDTPLSLYSLRFIWIMIQL
jgi:hypothetical protein